MSRFFTPVEFETSEIKKDEIKEISNEFPVSISDFVVEFNRIIRAIESGTSGIVKGGIQLKGAPVLAALDEFSRSATATSFQKFLDLTKQDISARARTEFLWVVRKNANKKLKKFLDEKGFTEWNHKI